MCKCLIYVLKISKISKKSKISKISDIFDIFDIFENITIFSNPGCENETQLVSVFFCFGDFKKYNVENLWRKRDDRCLLTIYTAELQCHFLSDMTLTEI